MGNKTSDQDGPITKGAAIRIARLQLPGKLGRTGLIQPAFYKRCSDAEDSRKSDLEGSRRAFGPVTQDRPKKKISRIERASDGDQDPYELTIIAIALGLPEDFFVNGFSSRAEFEKALAAKTRQGPVPQATKADMAAESDHLPVGFPNISLTETIPPSRREEATRLAETLSATRKSRLILLQGRTGVGKSYFIGHWFRDNGAVFGANALRIDCALSSLDQILPAIEQHFVTPGRVGTVADALAANTDNLIVLDGVRLDSDDKIVSGPGGARRFPLREFAEFLSHLVTPATKTTVIVCLENNKKAILDTAFVPVLDRRVSVSVVELKALTREEGAEFLFTLRRDLTDRRQRLELSARLHGLPMALVAAASELDRLSPAERETYLENVRFGETRNNEDDFAKFVREHLQRMDAVHESDDATSVDRHPHALLRLLALMPGPLPISHLEELLQEGTLRRLGGMTVDRAVRADVPFVEVSDSNIDVHAMVRRTLRAELDDFIKNDQYDAFTSRRELEWIHWRMAQLNWRVILNRKEASVFLVKAIESFVYHMIAQARLVPNGSGRRAKKFAGGVSKGTIDLFEQGVGKLTDAKLWQIAYQKAVRPFLLDKKHVATRIHGQYEAKARILLMLTTAANSGIPVPPVELAELHMEAALCWMHAGRLQSALQEAGNAKKLLPYVPRQFVAVAHPSDAHEAKNAEAWRLYCDVESVLVTIKCRQGRIYSETLEGLRPLLEIALELAAQPQWKASTELSKSAQSALRGAVRIISRAADMTLYEDDVEAAIALFDRADQLQHAVRDRPLDGEAARKYALALVRGRASGVGRFEHAVRLVDANIEHYEEVKQSFSGGLSNDVIPFLVLKAALQRISGRLDEASETLAGVRSHDFVRRSQCTFYASAELELEEIRVDILKGEVPRTEIVERGEAASRRLENAHHAVMAREAMLLAAEGADGKYRKEILRGCEQYFEQTNTLLRLKDVKELQDGSALRKFGL